MPKSCATFCQNNDQSDAYHPDDDGYNLLATKVFDWIVAHKPKLKTTTRPVSVKSDDWWSTAHDCKPAMGWNSYGTGLTQTLTETVAHKLTVKRNGTSLLDLGFVSVG